MLGTPDLARSVGEVLGLRATHEAEVSSLPPRLQSHTWTLVVVDADQATAVTQELEHVANTPALLVCRWGRVAGAG